jgi:glutathione peroxidase-family protein
MKIIICTAVILESIYSTSAQSFYDYNITTLDTVSHSLSEFAGKKVMIAILPATKNEDDSLYLVRLDSIYHVYSDRLIIIGVSSYEDGYTDDTTINSSQWYKSILDSEIVVTEGMYTHKFSDTLQTPLFNWLTHSQQNNHYDDEVEGAGETFFINEKGELYGVFGPTARWGDKLLNKMLSQ